jgi:hypothetical protein
MAGTRKSMLLRLDPELHSTLSGIAAARKPPVSLNHEINYRLEQSLYRQIYMADMMETDNEAYKALIESDVFKRAAEVARRYGVDNPGVFPVIQPTPEKK